MRVMPMPAHYKSNAGLVPVDLKNYRFRQAEPSSGKRASRAPVRFLVAFNIGVAAALAWQSYGDAARQAVARLSPQLGWLATSAAAAPTIPDMSEPTTPSVDRTVAARLEQIARSVDQLVQGQEQIMREMIRLQAISHYAPYNNPEPQPPALYTTSEPPPRPVHAPARNPVQRQPQATTVREPTSH